MSHSRFLREEEPLPSIASPAGVLGDASNGEEQAVLQQRELVRVQEFGFQFVKRRTEAEDQHLTLVSTQKHAMWYSEDGAKRKRFRSRGRDARGREVVHEVPLRIGDNWHLVFALTRPGASEEAARETHHLTVFQHMVDKALTVTHHTWVLPAETEEGTGGRSAEPRPSATCSPAAGTQQQQQQQQSSLSLMGAPESESLLAMLLSLLPFPSLFASSLPLRPPQSLSSPPPLPVAVPPPGSSHGPTCAPLKVATFNIWNFNEPWEERLQMIGHHMATAQPDVIGWQEVRYDISQPVRSQVEQLIELPAFKGYQFVWERGMTYLNFHSRNGWHVDEGVAIFSRFPITRADHRVLSRDMGDGNDREHQRVCLRARIRPPGSCCPLDFLVTHLTLSDPARDRAVVEIAEWVHAFDDDLNSPSTPFVFASYPSSEGLSTATTTDDDDDDDRDGDEDVNAAAVLVGDMNTEPGSRSMELLLEVAPAGRASFVDAWVALHPTANEPHASAAERGLSFPTWKPQKRIDFILVKRARRAVEVLDVRLMGNTTLAPEKRDLHKEVSSDHLGVWALLSLPSLRDDSALPLATTAPANNDEL